jgi:hypothetical protein
MNDFNFTETYIDHEVRIRLLEKTSKETINLLKWILGAIITIGSTIVFHQFNLI